jgi:hypothetical protein
MISELLVFQRDDEVSTPPMSELHRSVTDDSEEASIPPMLDLDFVQKDEEPSIPPMLELNRFQTDEDAWTPPMWGLHGSCHGLQTDDNTWIPSMLSLHRLQTDEEACFSHYDPSQSAQLPVRVSSQTDPDSPKLPALMELNRLQTDEDAWFPQYAPSQSEYLKYLMAPLPEVPQVPQVPSQANEAMREPAYLVTGRGLTAQDALFPPKSDPLQAPAPTQAQVLEAVLQLTELAKKMKFADLKSHNATAHLHPFIPCDDQGNRMSLGSILHAADVCKPCSFFLKGKCHKEELCMFCHFTHETRTQEPVSQKAKKTRKSRQQLQAMSQRHAEGTLPLTL